MKNVVVILSFLLVFALPSYSYASGLGSVHISYLDGDVRLMGDDTEGWIAATTNMPVREGDNISVSYNSRVELLSRNGTYLRLNENTFGEVLAAQPGLFEFYLESGQAYVNFKRTGSSSIAIKTPLISIKAYNKAVFRVDLSDYGDTEVSVLNGSVYAEDRRGSTKVVAGETLRLTDSGYRNVYALGPPDEWEKWNRDRDNRLSEYRYSHRYLPEELRVYSYDFDNNGKWVYVREYGYVWTPTVVVSVGWAPYKSGRWVWRGGDYVWLSYESWGWAPYHYGRWSFVASIGWCWIPPARGNVYWGPGFVGWVWTPTYVSWVPLAPGEIYYGYGYYGPHSVNIINININKTEIKHVYRNAKVAGAATVVSRETFVSTKPVEIKVKENPFLTERISIGRPPASPDAARSISVPREAPAIKHPSQRLRETDSAPAGRKPDTTPQATPSEKTRRTTTPVETTPSRQQYSPPDTRGTQPAERKQPVVREHQGVHQKQDRQTQQPVVREPQGRSPQSIDRTQQQKTNRGAKEIEKSPETLQRRDIQTPTDKAPQRSTAPTKSAPPDQKGKPGMPDEDSQQTPGTIPSEQKPSPRGR